MTQPASDAASVLPPLTELRYRADSPYAYADALLRLVKLARSTKDDFSFGPLTLTDCERDGILLIGPDLARAVAVLTLVPGLASTDR